MMTAEALVAGADANLVCATQVWASACDGGECWERDGLTIAASSVPMRSFNNVFLQQRPERPVETLSEVSAYFRDRGLPFRLRFLEGAPAPSEDDLAEWGLQRHGGIPCLALSPLRADASVSELTVRLVDDEATLRDHTAVVAEGFEWKTTTLSGVFTPRLIEAPEWRGYVGYRDGRPVATSQLVFTEGVAGVYYVATVEEARRRGFGEAMTRHALNEGAAAGCAIANLQASEMGEPIYRRMGFEQVGYYRTYVPEED
ncbi:MAG: GNAT family N-acetyltransferase [Dehalococcoidia bacterium]